MQAKVWVGNLERYTAGILSGKWITLPMDGSALQKVLEGILGRSEEYFIADSEAPFKVGEYCNLIKLNEILQELDDIDENLFIAIQDATEYPLKQIIDIIQNNSYTAYFNVNGLQDIAAEMVKEGLYGTVPEQLRYYIDYEAIGRDLDINGWHYCDKVRIAVYVD